MYKYSLYGAHRTCRVLILRTLQTNILHRRPLDERDYRFDAAGGAAERWGGPDTDRRRDAHPYTLDPQDRLPPSERLNPGYPDNGPAFAAGYPGDRYDRYPADNERYAGESAPYEAAGRDYYPEDRVGVAVRKYPAAVDDDFQTLRQRYDEEY